MSNEEQNGFFAKPVLGDGAVIGWWSGGITSAIACRLAIEKYPNVRLVYIETGSHHPDIYKVEKIESKRIPNDNYHEYFINQE